MDISEIGNRSNEFVRRLMTFIEGDPENNAGVISWGLMRAAAAGVVTRSEDDEAIVAAFRVALKQGRFMHNVLQEAMKTEH